MPHPGDASRDESVLGNRRDAEPTLVLLSLHDEYLRQIREGVKHFEYRRKYRREPTIAFVYVPAPVSAVTAALNLASPIIGPPDDIAAIAERDRSGAGQRIRRYLEGRSHGFAIPIRAYRDIEPISHAELLEVDVGFTPPQSYILLSERPSLRTLLTKRLGTPGS